MFHQVVQVHSAVESLNTKGTVATGKAAGQLGPKRLQLDGSIPKVVSRPCGPESGGKMVST
jgi:hypothetical protein